MPSLLRLLDYPRSRALYRWLVPTALFLSVPAQPIHSQTVGTRAAFASTEIREHGELNNTQPVGRVRLEMSTTTFNFNGTGTNQITVSLSDCPTCTMAKGSASGQGDLQSTGTYNVYSGSEAPFSLTADGNGDFTINQTAQIFFSYTSSEGARAVGPPTLLLIGTLTFVSAGPTNIRAMLTATGGTLARFFPNRGLGNVYIVLGFSAANGSLESLVGKQGVLGAFYIDATIVPIPRPN